MPLRGCRMPMGEGKTPPLIAAVDMGTADGLASAQHERDTRPDTM